MEKDKMDDKGTITSTSTSSDNADNAKAMQGTAYAILIIISISHFLNDMIQSVVPSIYPMIKEDFSLSFAQI
ncbi:MAG: MFS transporter, partial [Prevotella pectinovora]|nr:MFS transporter [Prevotella pectinovora]